MSLIDLLAAGLTLVNVWLVVRRSLWNYPFGLAAVAVSAAVFWREKLYSDVLLQGFFFLVQFYGWWVWARHREADGAVAVAWLDWRRRLMVAAVTLAATLGWGAAMHRYTDAALPWWDAANLMLSVVAQLLMSRRYAENWILWIVVDVEATGLYAAKGLTAFTALYVVLTAMASWGFYSWWRAGRTSAL
ncbi:nicotinamide riboside transporter PnuC [Sphingomonas sp.]|uniref:nicotinamide riboside transporter PnuC n=1 Tax=Sphingomonas sp. TaxID=28214 RepID=UPI003CC69FD4